jgi:hypothetical protein
LSEIVRQIIFPPEARQRGRCITRRPAGIDITEEATAMDTALVRAFRAIIATAEPFRAAADAAERPAAAGGADPTEEAAQS